jgi:hypothetical protein
MNLTRCVNGHFYDEEKYSSCPHCGMGARNDAETVGVNRNDAVTLSASAAIEELPTSMFVNPGVQPMGQFVQQAIAGVGNVDDDARTVGYYQRTMGTEPVVGWLVAIEGSHRGEDFKLKSGRNFVGRSAQMDVCLEKDRSIARERHAIVVYDPKTDTFLVQAGESKELFYLNDKVVLTVEELKPYDALSLGEARLIFVPFCNKDFNWETTDTQSETARNR